MRTIVPSIKKLFLCSTVLLFTVLSPLAVSTGLAASDPTVQCNPPANNQNGVHWPVGADAGTFTYQCEGTYAGYWTNTYYKYDPATTLRTALYDPDYSYDCTTQTWSMTEWDYSPASSTFVKSRVTPSVAPALPTGCPVAPATVSAASTPAAATPSTTTSSTDPSGSSISNTGTGSQNNANNNVLLNGSTTNTSSLSMGNNVFSNAATGNTYVIGNTTGGDATSGNAQSIANIANLLQSTSNVFGPNTTTFVANINGDANGDLLFDPSSIMNTGTGSQNAANNNLTVNSTNANNTNAQINNNINVGANSGNATVANNTTGGNANSGNASAIVDLMNVINSTIAAGESFVGVININGNLNGDILLPQGMLDQLLASTGGNSSNTANTNVTDNSKTSTTTSEGVNNNITSTANSGTATVANNTTGGSATTGTAGTNVTLLNLTGSNTVGKDDLLVFVNVLGHWVGMIVNAPAGSTAASLGGGITNTGTGSQNALNNNLTNNSTTTNSTTEGINNNVNVHATSGNASVTGNTTGGDATTGNANTAVNILNMEGSNLSLSDWFGVLFINVFGNWTGSFGVNTSAGDPVATSTTTTGSSTSSVPQVAQFVPTTSTPSSSSTGSTSSSSGSGTASETGGTVSDGSVLAANVEKPSSATSQLASSKVHHNYLIPVIGVIIALLLLFGEKLRFFRSTIR